MDTSKIKTNVILPTEEQKQEELKKEKKSLIWNYVWKIALLVLTLITIARVPYTGSYIDGLIDYLFGMTKYALYPLLLFVQISIIFHLPTEKVIKSKKFILYTGIGLLCIACIISGITDTIVYKSGTPSFVDIMNKYHSVWTSYFLAARYDQAFANTGFISGGIVAVLISFLFNFLSYVVLAIFAIIGLCLCIFMIFNINYRSTKIGLKLRNWMIKKLGGTFKYDGFDELKEIRNNQNKFKKVAKQDIIDNATTKDALSIELLPETDVTCYNQNFKIAGNIQDKIQEFFKKNEIDVIPSELNVYTSFSELCFEAKGKKEVEKVITNGEQIKDFVKLDTFNLTIRGNIITFEIPNTYFSKISMKSALQLMPALKDVTAVFALDKQSKPFSQNFRNQPTAIILGKKGSGSATLAVLMALSTCYITKPSELELRVLSASSEATFNAFTKLPHTNGKIADGIGECIDQINELQNLINKRVSMFKALDVTNIDQYNASIQNPNDKIKHILILASNFEHIIKESFQNSKVINDILVNGPKVGVYTILQSYHAGIEAMDDMIYNVCSQKYILKLEEDGESERIFESQRGCQLHGTGDCLTYSKGPHDMVRLQICNINQAELAQDVEIIKTFYETKQENELKKVESIETSAQVIGTKEETAHVVEQKQESSEEKHDTKKIVEEKKEEESKTIQIDEHQNEVKVEDVKEETVQVVEEEKPIKKEFNPDEIRVFTPFRFEPNEGLGDDDDNQNNKK